MESSVHVNLMSYYLNIGVWGNIFADETRAKNTGTIT